MDTNSTAIMARLDAIDARLAQMAARQERSEDLFREMGPIIKEVMATATTKLDGLDKAGYFAFGRELVTLSERVVTGFSPADVRQLADAVVSILRTVRAMTQPRVLEMAGQASKVIEKADETEPLGLIGMVRATRDDDVQKGMAVMMELMRHVGHVATAVREEQKKDADKKDRGAERKAKLAAALGPRRKGALGIERPGAAASAELPPPSACAVPKSTSREAAAVIDGVAFTADGHMVDPSAWTQALAHKIAAAESVNLDEARMPIVTFARADFEKNGVSPNIRRLTQGTGLGTKELYALFPKAPARTIAKIAGIPKPAGCI
ncbi:MAG: TusE/DsrC/DsvC family sulfur relay protein [Myxococcales bacterium]|nr:TusE/DsrC/DsvC family sulfur relay protein [Myxococcales bacterium]